MPFETKVRHCPTTNTHIDIAYEEFGNPDDHPILLVPGLGATCRSYDDSFVNKLVAAGHRVIRMDNRDSGLSTNGTDSNWQDPWLVTLLTPSWLSPAPVYTLEDMARDAWALLDRLKIKYVTLWGTSMGGKIVSWMSLQQPTRVVSLVSAMTSTGGSGLSGPPYWLQFELLKSPPKNATIEETVAYRAAMVQKCFIPAKDEVQFKIDQAYVTQNIRNAQSRSTYRQGGLRQIYAILHGKPREQLLKQLTELPVFILHGKKDLVFAEDHAVRQKEIFQDALLHLVDDMGHWMEPKHMDGIVAAVSKHIDEAKKKKNMA